MKILIIGPAWVGDMVMAQGLFKSLLDLNPYAKIDVLAPDWTRPLLERMPEIHHTYSLPFKHGEFAFLKRFQLGRSLKSQGYDQAIVMPNSWKSALVPFFAGISKRTGWRGEMRYGLLNNILNYSKPALMIEQFIALSGIKKENYSLKNLYPSLTIDHQHQKSVLEKYNLNINSSKKIIALCPGAEFGPSKQWPADYYAQIANHFLEQHYAVWLMGSVKDQTITNQINSLTQQRCENFAGKTTLSDAIDLLSLSLLVITNDSGLMHIASALDKKIIALYGSTSPAFTPPLSDHAHILSISPEVLKCRPCFQRTCPLLHHRCMKDLLPQQVITIASQACAH